MPSLWERYTYGLAEQRVSGDGEQMETQSIDALPVDGAEQQNRMIALVRQQIAAQQAASRAMAASGVAGAKQVAAEVAQQAAILANAIDTVASETIQGMASTPNEMTEFLFGQERALCFELAEIKWWVAQQGGGGGTPETVLGISCQHQTNAVQRLLRQGVRHYVNGEYQEAEQRFRRALKRDSTDYQVLTNLGYIAIRKEDEAGALLFFNKALTLPEGLDKGAQARTLWAMSRVAYAQADPLQAYAFARRAYEKSQAVEQLFLSACYAALVDLWEEAWHGLAQAIHLDGRFFARAAVEPVLAPVQERVFSWLASLAQQRASTLAAALDECRQVLRQTEAVVWHPVLKEILLQLEQEAAAIQGREEGYADMGQRLADIQDLHTLLVQIKKCDQWFSWAAEGKQTLAMRIAQEKQDISNLMEQDRQNLAKTQGHIQTELAQRVRDKEIPHQGEQMGFWAWLFSAQKKTDDMLFDDEKNKLEREINLLSNALSEAQAKHKGVEEALEKRVRELDAWYLEKCRVVESEEQNVLHLFQQVHLEKMFSELPTLKYIRHRAFFMEAHFWELPIPHQTVPVENDWSEEVPLRGEWCCPLTGMVFVWVPEGTFQMGDLFGDGRRDEKPVHEVQLDGFWLGKFPVRQGEWQKIMGSNPSYFKKGDDYPVEQVSWEDGQQFIKKLNDRGEGKYRLPTEAEWEYACRSGGRKERYAGGDDIDRVAWYASNSGGLTHPVGQKRPNGLGLYDMSGNVWEWVADWYDEHYYGRSPQANPQGPSAGSGRVIRGGSWYNVPAGARSANRFVDDPSHRFLYLGLRLLRMSSP
ncbi:MAG: SUMF1/EgtB/PvdO family nonheme iron enzyme [Magnetococcales bacterium]|nr:SUMF1/EgtB/PvdO family nonheme iron enzyme [Magnetococcales bacterium]